MTTAVLDTNVLVSAFVGVTNSHSVPGQLLRAWLLGVFHLVVSAHILDEVTRTLAKPYFRRRLTLTQIVAAHSLLTRRAVLAQITVRVQRVAAHPEDDLILATALSANADFLVTGDEQLQRLGSYQGVQIVGPRAFLAVLGNKGRPT